jgi:hypothetical protein
MSVTATLCVFETLIIILFSYIFRYLKSFIVNFYRIYTGADPGFQVRGGAHLKKLRRAEGGANIFGVFRVKNLDFTPKNHIFSNFRGVARNFWDISCEKSRFYAKKIIFFPILGGARAGYAPPP